MRRRFPAFSMCDAPNMWTYTKIATQMQWINLLNPLIYIYFKTTFADNQHTPHRSETVRLLYLDWPTNIGVEQFPPKSARLQLATKCDIYSLYYKIIASIYIYYLGDLYVYTHRTAHTFQFLSCWRIVRVLFTGVYILSYTCTRFVG